MEKQGENRLAKRTGRRVDRSKKENVVVEEVKERTQNLCFGLNLTTISNERTDRQSFCTDSFELKI